MQTELDKALQQIAIALCESGIKKDENLPGNKGGKKFRGIGGALKACAPLFAQHGVVIYPSKVKELRVREVPTSKGGVQFFTLISYEFTVRGHGESFTCEFAAEAQDAGDAGAVKVASIAWSRLIFLLFSVPTEETEIDHYAETQPEAAPTPPPARPIDYAADPVPRAQAPDPTRFPPSDWKGAQGKWRLDYLGQPISGAPAAMIRELVIDLDTLKTQLKRSAPKNDAEGTVIARRLAYIEAVEKNAGDAYQELMKMQAAKVRAESGIPAPADDDIPY